MNNIKVIALSALAFVTIASTVFVSCQKVETTIVPSSTKTVKNNRSDDMISFNGSQYFIKDGILTFETFDKYENLFEVENPIEIQKFADIIENSSNMTSYTETEMPIDIKEKLHIVGKLVNSDGVIKIDVFTLLLNFEDKVIYATRYGTYQDLINANKGTLATSVYKLDMEDDETIDALMEIKTRGILCKESFASGKTNSANLSTNVCDKYNNVDVKYIQYGILFEIIVNYGVSSGTCSNNKPHYKCVTTGWWQRRCSSVSGNINSTVDFLGGSGGGVSNGSNELWYLNCRALKHYNVTSVLSSTNSTIAGATATANINS